MVVWFHKLSNKKEIIMQKNIVNIFSYYGYYIKNYLQGIYCVPGIFFYKH